MVCWVGFLLYFTALLSIKCRLAAIVKGGGKRGRNGVGPQTGKSADTEQDESGTGISFEEEEEDIEVEDLLSRAEFRI